MAVKSHVSGRLLPLQETIVKTAAKEEECACAAAAAADLGPEHAVQRMPVDLRPGKR